MAAKSFMPRGRLRRDRAPARKAEPGIGTVTAELGGAQFLNFEDWFDDEGDLPCRAARRTNLPRRTLGRADEAQPQASGDQCRRDPSGETRAFVGFTEDVEAAAVKNELERTLGRGGGEKVQGSETATQIATIQLRNGSFDREWSHIDAQYIEAALCQPKGIRPRPHADLERHGGLNAARGDKLDQQRLGLSRVPGKLSRGVALVPTPMRHQPRV
jgi:hypothetical protein